MTPLLSVIHYIDEECKDTIGTLIYTSKTEEELLQKDILLQISQRNKNIRCIFSLTGETSLDSKDTALVGRIREGHVMEAVEEWKSCLYFISGPSQMIKDTVAMLHGMGVPKENVRYELW